VENERERGDEWKGWERQGRNDEGEGKQKGKKIKK
jgi:hypothetical protein